MDRDRGFETVMAVQCAPTLAGLKPASLFRWRGPSSDLERRWGPVLAPSGLGIRILASRGGGDLVYLYRARWIRQILSEPRARAFLASLGYDPAGGTGGLLRELSRRLGGGSFPHEVGIFLGYPLEDVEGFMADHGRHCTCCGCWKSYGDPEAARRRFDQYRRCTEAYREQARQGVPIARLIRSA